MKHYWISLLFVLVVSVKSYGQMIRLNNSFIILINDKLVTNVAGVRIISTDRYGKEDSIDGGYLPGVLYVDNMQKRNLFTADSLKKLTLKFDYYESKGKNLHYNNYSIKLNRKWFKESMIIVEISDVNKRKGTYNYTFEVPGVSFGKTVK